MKSFTRIAALAVCIASAAAQYAINPTSVNNDTRRMLPFPQIRAFASDSLSRDGIIADIIKEDDVAFAETLR
jgi:hypothetical protein